MSKRAKIRFLDSPAFIQPAFAACLLLVQALYAAWHSLNRLYPREDSGQYFATGQAIYLKFADKGFWEGVKSFYLLRSPKPILHPALQPVFLALTNGNVRWAIALANAVYFSVFFLFVFKILRLKLSPARALLGSVFTGTLPWIAASHYFPMAEMPFLAAVMVFFYGMLTLKRGSPHMLGAAFGLSVCFRPVEALVLLGPVLAAFAVERVKTGSRRRWCFERKILLAAGTGLAISVVWLGPFLKDLFEWAFLAVWGKHTLDYGGRQGLGLLAFVFVYLRNLGGVALVLLAAFAAIRLALQPALRKRLPPAKWAFAFGWVFFGPLLVSAISYNGDLRYYYPGASAIFLAALVFTLSAEAAYPRIATAAVAAATAFQLVFLASATFGFGQVEAFFVERRFFPWPDLSYRPHLAPDPVEEVFEQVRKLTGDVPAQIADARLWTAEEIDSALGTAPLKILSRERTRYNFAHSGTPAKLSPEAFAELFADYKSWCGYFLVGPVGGQVVRQGTNPDNTSGLIGAHILEHWKKGTVQSIGLKFTGKVTAHDHAGKAFELLLFQRL